MVEFELLDPLHVSMKTENDKVIKYVREYLTDYVDGFLYMPAYKLGRWDGKISLFDPVNNSFPYGLILDVVKRIKKEFKEEKFSYSDEIIELFTGIEKPPVWNLNLYPYDYQEEVILACLKQKRGVIRSATASGKSLMIAYIIKTLLENNEDFRLLLIVPNVSLISQFFDDMKSYGMDMSKVGLLYSKRKDYESQILISTWQSLQKNYEIVNTFNGVIVDECHSSKAKILRDILKSSPNPDFRLGFTGTLPSSKLDELTVKSYLGPVLKDFSSVVLAEKGYVSKCVVNMVGINYKRNIEGAYDEIREEIFNSTYRQAVIKHIVRSLDHPVLILVELVEKEGEILENELKQFLPDREVVFLSGRNKEEEREHWRKYADGKNKCVLIATYGIFQQGINIKSLRSLIFASPSKSKIRVLQSIGRTLRKHTDKINGAIIWDIVDKVKFLEDHSEVRIRYYNKEKFPFKEIELTEGGRFDDLDRLIKGKE